MDRVRGHLFGYRAAMFDGHRVLRGERKRIGVLALGALAIAVYASLGFPWRRLRRPSHWPFAFADYSWLDTIVTVLGLTIGGWMLFRWWTLDRKLVGLEKTQDYRFFLRAGAPRAIHGLLLRVAAHDGDIDSRERDVVQRVLLRDLTEKVLPQDIRNWSVADDKRDAIAIAKGLVAILEPAERLAVLRWCREVAAADGEVVQEESELLRDLQRVLGKPAA